MHKACWACAVPAVPTGLRVPGDVAEASCRSVPGMGQHPDINKQHGPKQHRPYPQQRQQRSSLQHPSPCMCCVETAGLLVALHAAPKSRICGTKSAGYCCCAGIAVAAERGLTIAAALRVERVRAALAHQQLSRELFAGSCSQQGYQGRPRRWGSSGIRWATASKWQPPGCWNMLLHVDLFPAMLGGGCTAALVLPPAAHQPRVAQRLPRRRTAAVQLAIVPNREPLPLLGPPLFSHILGAPAAVRAGCRATTEPAGTVCTWRKARDAKQGSGRAKQRGWGVQAAKLPREKRKGLSGAK